MKLATELEERFNKVDDLYLGLGLKKRIRVNFSKDDEKKYFSIPVIK